MILYECKGQDFSSLTAEQLKGDVCERSLVSGCRGGPIVAAWAVGGQVRFLLFRPCAGVCSVCVYIYACIHACVWGV